LSHGVTLATQNKVLALLPRLRAGAAAAGPAAARAATPPIKANASLRVVSIGGSPLPTKNLYAFSGLQKSARQACKEKPARFLKMAPPALFTIPELVIRP
jgi:hypothetical protein